MYTSEYDVVCAHTCPIFSFVALYYAQNKLCYYGADAVSPHNIVFPIPVYERAYSCLAVMCLMTGLHYVTRLQADPNITVKGRKLETVDKFTYLGNTLSRNVLIDDEVDARIAKVSTAFGMLRKNV